MTRRDSLILRRSSVQSSVYETHVLVLSRSIVEVLLPQSSGQRDRKFRILSPYWRTPSFPGWYTSGPFCDEVNPGKSSSRYSRRIEMDFRFQSVLPEVFVLRRGGLRSFRLETRSLSGKRQPVPPKNDSTLLFANPSRLLRVAWQSMSEDGDKGETNDYWCGSPRPQVLSCRDRHLERHKGRKYRRDWGFVARQETKIRWDWNFQDNSYKGRT